MYSVCLTKPWQFAYLAAGIFGSSCFLDGWQQEVFVTTVNRAAISMSASFSELVSQFPTVFFPGLVHCSLTFAQVVLVG